MGDPLDVPPPGYVPAGARADRVWGPSPGAPVGNQPPVRALGVDIGAGPTFIRAVVPLDEIGLDLRRGAEASQLARPDRPLQGTGEHRGEGQSLQPLSEPESLGFAVPGQWHVGQARVLTRDGPGRLTVPRQIREGKRAAHGFDFLPLKAPPPARGDPRSGESRAIRSPSGASVIPVRI